MCVRLRALLHAAIVFRYSAKPYSMTSKSKHRSFGWRNGKVNGQRVREVDGKGGGVKEGVGWGRVKAVL